MPLNTLNQSSRFLPAVVPRRPAGSRLLARIWPIATLGLLAATSLALWVYASPWLVPPYLALMGMVLGVPGGRREKEPASPQGATKTGKPSFAERFERSERDGEGRFATPHQTMNDSENPDEAKPGFDRILAHDDTNVDAGLAGSEPAALKAKRGRGRGRKAKLAASAAAANAGATWVRIGPGKFVRADAALSVENEYTGPPSGVEEGELEAEAPRGPAADVNDTPVLETPGEELLDIRDSNLNAEREDESSLAPARELPKEPSRTTSGMEQPARAVEPGASDAEGEGSGVFGELNLGRVDDAGLAPDGLAAAMLRDNGIAPDAPSLPALDVADDASQPHDLEAAAIYEHEPEPFAKLDDPDSDLTRVSDSLLEPEPVMDPEPSLPPRRLAAYQDSSHAMGTSRTLGVSVRGTSRRRIAAAATAAGSRWSAKCPGNVRRSRRACVLGSRLHPRRVRNAGRFHQADRTHKPRSPPLRNFLMG